MDNITGPTWTFEQSTDSPWTADSSTEASFHIEPLFDNIESVLYEVGHILHIYVQPSIQLLGVITNFLALIVFLGPRNWNSSPCIYLAFLAGFDAGTLLSNLIYFVTTWILKLELHPINCRLMILFSGWASMASNLILAAMSVERMIVTKYPMKALYMCTAKRARIVCTLLSILAFITKSTLIPSVHLSLKEAGQISKVICYPLLNAIVGAIDALITIILPTIIICAMNGIIIRSVYSKNTDQAISSTARQQRSERTGLLIIVSALFCISMTVSMSFAIMHSILNEDSDTVNPILYIGEEIMRTVGMINYAGNFWLYAMSGSRFRKDLKKALICTNCFC